MLPFCFLTSILPPPPLYFPFFFPNAHRDECVLHVQKALEMAISRDGASGGIIRLCVVTSKGADRWTVVPGGVYEDGERGVEGGG